MTSVLSSAEDEAMDITLPRCIVLTNLLKLSTPDMQSNELKDHQWLIHRYPVQDEKGEVDYTHFKEGYQLDIKEEDSDELLVKKVNKLEQIANNDIVRQPLKETIYRLVEKNYTGVDAVYIDSDCNGLFIQTTINPRHSESGQCFKTVSMHYTFTYSKSFLYPIS